MAMGTEGSSLCGKILMLCHVSETFLCAAQGAHLRRKLNWAVRMSEEERVHWRRYGATWSAWRSKSQLGHGCSTREESPWLKHDAVGHPGGASLQELAAETQCQKITWTQDSAP